MKDIQEKLKKVLAFNNIKPGSKKAKDAEYFFLQGILAGEDSDLAGMNIVVICLMSGRSILSV